MSPAHVEKAILEAIQLDLTPHLEKLHEYRYLSEPGEVEVKCQQTDDPLTKTLVLRILFDHEHKNIQIPNIFMPQAMTHQGIGKKTMQTIFDVARPLGYELYIIELVNSFKNRLLNRGAILVLEDAVKITDQTNLRSGH
ncbi:hypothetical protein [Achromobacter sp. 2789STDY5608633]|uniref:hypothetical protein n=1 Tax=Achromobacter sp. 2789STDY5608633 TaxID=1806501 RepID=UPI0012E2EAA9|nr:hypothetical protein [Achromobacter sp. 2789STDY5608633]